MDALSSSSTSLASSIAQLQSSVLAIQAAMTAIASQTVNLQILLFASEPQKIIASLMPPPGKRGTGQNLNILA